MRIGPDHPLLLASGSPRRRELLAQLRIPLVVEPVHVDERVHDGEEPHRYLERVVEAKLLAAEQARGADARLARCAAALVADTAVVLGSRVLGKPEDDDEAAGMIAALSGRCHQVMTRYAIAAGSGVVERRTVVTDVWFRPLGPEDVAAYVRTGEGRDKAGAYAVQGVGAMLVERIAGSYTNVVGLPLCEVVAALQNAGLVGVCPA